MKASEIVDSIKEVLGMELAEVKVELDKIVTGKQLFLMLSFKYF